MLLIKYKGGSFMNSKDILNDKRNFIFIGESGCGKTELSLNLSKRIALMKKNIHK